MREPSRHAARWGVLAGAVAAAGGTGVAELAAAVLRRPTSAVTAVAQQVIALTPGEVAERGIQAVGHADKPLVVTGVVVGLLVLGGVAGWLALRSLPAAVALMAALTVAGVVAVLQHPATGGYDIAPVVLGGVVGVMLLAWLVRRAGASVPASSTDAAYALSRRGFLLRSGLVAAAALVATGASRVLTHSRDAVVAARRSLRLSLPTPQPPQGADLGVPGVAPWQTPNDRFYRVDTSVVIPLVVPAAWKLRVHGMVDNPLEITFADLVQRPMTDAWVTLCCVSNPVGGPLVGNALWTGVRVTDVLADARPHPDADAVLSRSDDGFTIGTPLAALTDGRDALLAVGMNGRPLPLEHGFPVRMVVPGLYGFVSATKWIVDMQVTRFDRFSAYWTERGWAEKAPIKTESRIDTPHDGATKPPGLIRVGGVAWAQHRGIEKVEVRADDQPWQQATLGRVPGVDTWVQWAWDWHARAGGHHLQVRATDRDGHTQTEAEAQPVPDGASGWHTVSVIVG